MRQLIVLRLKSANGARPQPPLLDFKALGKNLRFVRTNQVMKVPFTLSDMEWCKHVFLFPSQRVGGERMLDEKNK